jgi:hypothetical protein
LFAVGPVTFHLLPRQMGADNHVGIGNIANTAGVVFDWLADQRPRSHDREGHPGQARATFRVATLVLPRRVSVLIKIPDRRAEQAPRCCPSFRAPGETPHRPAVRGGGRHPDGKGPATGFLKVAEGKPDEAKTGRRIHLDIMPIDRPRDEEFERLKGIGATEHEDHRKPDGTGWVTMAGLPPGKQLRS